MLTIRFGDGPSRVEVSDTGSLLLRIDSPVTSGAGEESFPFPMGAVTHADGWVWSATEDTLCGVAVVATDDAGLESTSRRLYEAMLRRLHGLHPYRVWHHVPRINGEHDGMENYRRFCRARAEAFEACFPADFERRLCAASAVGVDGDRLVLVVLAGRDAPTHFENPEQTPAYRYPERYGPKSPSFARATSVRLDGVEWIFVSGTASILGSESRHPGDFDAQARLTSENLGRMLSVSGASPSARVMARTYIKPSAGARAGGVRVSGFQPQASSEVLADICRSELLLETELTVIRT